MTSPIDALLFNKFAVIVVLSTGWITYTIIPLYAAMKAIDPKLFQAAQDLGAGWFTIARRILIPLAAPGIFVAVLLVYIPLVYRLRGTNIGWWHQRVHVGSGGERPDPD